MIFKYQIKEDISLRDYLKHIKIPSSVISSFKNNNGQMLVNDQTVNVNYQLKEGDLLEIVFPSTMQGENIKSIMGDFKIIYEDSYLLIIDKIANLACIPTRAHYDHSLANYVMSYYKRQGIEANIHFLSRLDAATSGLVTLTKNSYMLTLMKNSNLEKHYILEVDGVINEDEGMITTGIEKDPSSIIKRQVTNEFINSKTIFKVIKRTENSTFVDALLCTGKTHQLRLHFLSIGHPIIGDLLYNDNTPKSQDDTILHLHSYKLKFSHPITHQPIELISYPNWYKVS